MACQSLSYQVLMLTSRITYLYALQLPNNATTKKHGCVIVAVPFSLVWSYHWRACINMKLSLLTLWGLYFNAEVSSGPLKEKTCLQCLKQ